MDMVKEIAQTAQCLKDLKRSLDDIKKSMWRICLVAAIIGGLFSKITPELVNGLIRMAFAAQ